MLDNTTRKRIDDCRDILVGKLPDPKSQIEQITIALIYKFMDDMDKESIELGGEAKFFSGDYEKYSWDNLFDAKVTASEMLKLYSEAIESMEKNPNIPQLFRDIFKNAYLPYRDPETLKLFLKTIGEFEYTHSEKLGDAFEYLLSVMGSQGDAGQFRTPRHIIDFLVKAVDPNKTDTILDPACGTAGFLISAFKHIKIKNKKGLTPDERKRLIKNFIGYDISPDMVRLSLVNLYLHGFSEPHIFEYDTLTSEERWNDSFDIVLANPPFMSPKGGIRPHKKFTVTSNRSEVLFVDYIAEHLNPNGKAGIIVPEGVIFQSGKAYKQLRKMLVDDYLYAVVSLPAGVFNPYSGVKTSILLMDKAIAKKTDKILFVKIDNDGYNLGAQRNKVKGGQLGDAVELLKEYKKATNARINNEDISALVAKYEFAHAIEKTKIGEDGDYNLSGERYKEQIVINSNFPIVKLGEVVEVIAGQSPKSEYYNYSGEGLPFYQGKTEFGDRVIGKPKTWTAKVTKEAFRKDILMSVRAPVGPVNLATENICIGRGLAALRVKEKIKVKYLFELLRFIEPKIKGNSGAVFSNISRKQIEAIEIPLPPLSIQEEIVTEIEGYQKIIDGARMVVENYKPQIDIDPDWEMVELGSLAKLIGGGTPSRKVNEYWENGDIDWVSCSDFKNNSIYLSDSIRKITKTGLENSSSNLIDKDTLILVTRVSLGKLAFTSKPTAINQDLTALKFISDSVDKFYAYYYILSIADKIERDGNGITVKGVNREYVKKIGIPLPPIEIQKQIVSRIENEQKLVNANKELISIFEQKIKDRIAKIWGE